MIEHEHDDFGAFVPGQKFRIAGRAGGPLSGLTFAAKDLFDVAGHPTGGGNPDWARTNPVPERHAWAVQTLLDAGADLIGKTITDEVSLGILGENPFYGTPVNPRAPGHVPGGSSSGSAAAVAGGLCDTALGTDTGGSVRVPASFCGLYGIRPTHGRIDVAGMMNAGAELRHDGLVRARRRDLRPGLFGHARRGDPRPASAPAAHCDRCLRTLPTPTRQRHCSRSSTSCARLIGDVGEAILAPPGLAAWHRAQTHAAAARGVANLCRNGSSAPIRASSSASRAIW